jgi:hypothetical protein
VTDLAAKKRLRFEVMRRIYEEANGSCRCVVDRAWVRRSVDFPAADAELAVDYLLSERLLAFHGPQGLKLTQPGVVEVEAAMERPGGATEHFLAVNIIAIGHMVGSQIVQGVERSSAVGRQEGEDMGSDWWMTEESRAYRDVLDRAIALKQAEHEALVKKFKSDGLSEEERARLKEVISLHNDYQETLRALLEQDPLRPEKLMESLGKARTGG